MRAQLRQILFSQLFCVGVALLLTLVGNRWWVALVYSLLIGNLIMVLVQSGRRAISRHLLRRRPDDLQLQQGWPGWGLMLPVLLAASLLGFPIGQWLGDLLTGHSTLPLWQRSSQGLRVWVAILVLSWFVTLGATAYFSFRERLRLAETRLTETARLAAETRLKLIESQLEPHMLFNTLGNLRALISLDPPQALVMLDRLIDFLRATLQGSRSTLHPLALEFQRLDDYLALMKIRMGERLQVRLDLPDTLAALPVPPLLLQPLVENAIQHGLEPHRGAGTLCVRAQRCGEHAHQVQLTVEDDGVGLAVGTATTAGTGFGTDQVRQRLAALYGPDAHLSLESRAGGGTTACIVLPLEPPEIDHAHRADR